MGLADGVCGRVAGNGAKTCPGVQLAPSRPHSVLCCCFSQPEEWRVGSREVQLQEMLPKSFIKEQEMVSGLRPSQAAF